MFIPSRRLLVVPIPLLIFALVFLFVSVPAQAQVGESQKISNTEGGLEGTIEDGDGFGFATAQIDDLNGDGNAELVVGAPLDNGGTGAVWVLFLNDDGTVASHQKISDTEGGFDGDLSNVASFGGAVAEVGDLNGDDVPDLAVGSTGEDFTGTFWILFLNDDGTVSGSQEIADDSFGGELDNDDLFGSSFASVGDLDGDGVQDLVVGARRDDDGAEDRGAVWVLFLNDDGTVADHQKISDTQGGFTGTLDDDGWFGSSAASVGDVNADGVTDLAVGAPNLGSDSIWILFLNSDGTVSGSQKIADGTGGFEGEIDFQDNFGSSAARMDDLDGDGVPDVAVGALGDDDGASAAGALWILLLNDDGTVASSQKISATQGGFDGSLSIADQFGTAATAVGDLDGDSRPDLAVGAKGGDASWVLFGNEAPLPVELTSFEAVRDGNHAAQLRWTTASEQNNAGFAIQQKAPAEETWTKRGFVESNAPGGTTTDAQSYRFTAENLSVGTHQFRLKQVDLDGTAHPSKTVTVEIGLDQPVRLTAPAPNPVRNRATLSFAVKEVQKTTIRLYNVLGQKVSTLYRGTPAAEELKTVDLSASDLPSGAYFLRLQAGEHTRTQRMTVVR